MGSGDLKASEGNTNRDRAYFSDFRTGGVARDYAGLSQVDLGPASGKRWTNDAEIVFKLYDYLTKAKEAVRYEYRMRQSIAAAAWQSVNGVWAKIVMVAEGTEDNPDPLLQKVDPPTFSFIDTPGIDAFQAQPGAPTLPLGNKVRSNPKATKIVVKNNFVSWVEARKFGTEDGDPDYVGPFTETSNYLTWHDILRIERPSPQGKWAVTAACEVGQGHISLSAPE